MRLTSEPFKCYFHIAFVLSVHTCDEIFDEEPKLKPVVHYRWVAIHGRINDRPREVSKKSDVQKALFWPYLKDNMNVCVRYYSFIYCQPQSSKLCLKLKGPFCSFGKIEKGPFASNTFNLFPTIEKVLPNRMWQFQ